MLLEDADSSAFMKKHYSTIFIYWNHRRGVFDSFLCFLKANIGDLT